MPKGFGALLSVIVAAIVIWLIVYLLLRSASYGVAAAALFLIALYIVLKKLNIL